MYVLDNSHCAEFKAEVVNDMQKGSSVSLDDLNKMYVIASRRVVVKPGKDGGGATFAKLDQTPKKGNNPKTPSKSESGNLETLSSEETKSKEEKAAARLARMKCFNCGGKGHPARNCPHKENGQGEAMAGMTLDTCCASRSGRIHESHEICIDNGSQVNIVNSRLLTNIRTSSKSYRSMSGRAETDRVGNLEGFFECQACDDFPTSIISMADVEDLYEVTYVQGESITVNMDHMDVVFLCRDKMYIADFLDWLQESAGRERELRTQLNLMAVTEAEGMYTRKEVIRALQAGEFLKALGYPSERDALEVLRAGNIRNIPYSADDVRRFYTIYGTQVEVIRGKTTKKHADPRIMKDEGAKLQLTNQDLVMDVMHVAGEKFLVSLCTPLGLLLVCHLQSQSIQELGSGLQKHVNTLRSRGFEAKKVMVDPHKSFQALQGSFPGVEIDPTGAGDHLDKVDTKIKGLKELMCSVVSGLPYRLARERIKDLVTYSVGRMNLRGTDMLLSDECPRVRFTGQRPEYTTELGLAFGNYVEAYNPKAKIKSNDIFTPRIEPCIALYQY
jgi:hypothetical protein